MAQRDVARRVVDERLTRDAVAEVVREVADRPIQAREPRQKPAPAEPPPSPSRTLKTDIARIVVTSSIGPLADDELIVVLQEAIDLLRMKRTRSA